MEPHRDTRIEKRKHVQCLVDSLGHVVRASGHELLDIETIVLLDTSLGREHEEYRFVSIRDEVVIDLWDSLFCPFEEPSTYRDADTFFLDPWESLQFLVLIEEYYIMYHDTWDLEGLEELLATSVSHEDKISRYKERLQCELARYHRHLQRYPPEEEERSCYTGDLGAEVPLTDKIVEGYSRFVIEYDPTTTDDDDI